MLAPTASGMRELWRAGPAGTGPTRPQLAQRDEGSSWHVLKDVRGQNQVERSWSANGNALDLGRPGTSCEGRAGGRTAPLPGDEVHRRLRLPGVPELKQVAASTATCIENAQADFAEAGAPQQRPDHRAPSLKTTNARPRLELLAVCVLLQGRAIVAPGPRRGERAPSPLLMSPSQSDGDLLLSVVIPVLNEEASRCPCSTAGCARRSAVEAHELVFVDDGSTDASVARSSAGRRARAGDRARRAVAQLRDGDRDVGRARSHQRATTWCSCTPTSRTRRS